MSTTRTTDDVKLSNKQLREMYPTMKANQRQVGGSHYKTQKIQHWDIVVANNIPYLEACAMKYIMRHRNKKGREDLEKAIHFIEKILETTYPNKP